MNNIRMESWNINYDKSVYRFSGIIYTKFQQNKNQIFWVLLYVIKGYYES